MAWIFLSSFFEFVKDLVEATGMWLGYISSLDSNMKNLKRKIEYLSSQEDDINTELSCVEQQSSKRRKKEVEVWLKDVQTIKGDVRTLQRLEQEVVGWKYVFSRAWLGKLVAEKIQEAAELQEKGRFSNGLLIDALPPSGRFIPTMGSFGETTSARIMEKVWKYFMDDKVRKIGVYGMGGIGKTTIMHRINYLLLNETHFGVIWITVSKSFNIRKLQRQIAKELDLDISNYGDETTQASKLYTELSPKKRYVLILDDLWEPFSLEKVGIPEPTRSNGCKLVLTTRSLEVCRKMECRTVKMELLTEEEALNLFMSKVEDHQTELTPEVKEIATKVAKECVRLPLALITVAGSMRGINDINEWENAFNELISTKQISDTESEVFERLQFSYNRLKDELLQHCFLYCALYPNDYNIPREELIDYWIAEGLITEMNSIEAMFMEGHIILNKLINACLLENLTNTHNVKCVRMHDLVRDMALKITAISPRFMVQAGEGLVRVPYEDWSKDLERVSLMYNNIEELPFIPPVCPQLTTLLLRENRSALLQIPDSFFTHMHSLKVLDLSFTSIQSLPKSISKLLNLHALLLENCWELNYVPSLEKLKALKELKLNDCQIEEVPQGIEELANLRNLNLSWNYKLHAFPCGKLCRLSQLQHLRIDRTGAKVSAEELLCLTQLKVLGVQFHNVQELSSYVTSQQCQSLENYRLLVGNDLGYWICTMENKLRHQVNPMGKEVCVYIDPELPGNVVDSLVLPSNVEFFEIERCHDLISLLDILSLRDAKNLRTCKIRYCNGIESIFSSSSFSEDCQIPLRTIESFDFVDLPNLWVLFDGFVLPHDISFNLTKLYLDKCPRIKNIFPAKLLQNFPNLENLVVSECVNVEDIIVDEEMSYCGHHQDDRNTITLQNLKWLRLQELPRLKSICKSLIVCESLEDIVVVKCPMLKRLPLSLLKDDEQALAPPALQQIVGKREWWESLEWDDLHTKTILQDFFDTSYTDPGE